MALGAHNHSNPQESNMTRINIGVEPRELCDQHLLAEYRELPRCWDKLEASEVLYEQYKQQPPTLGQGHVLWCCAFMGSLSDRFKAIVKEMQYRGFTCNYTAVPPQASTGHKWNLYQHSTGRSMLIERLAVRLANMRREPKWTKSAPFRWAEQALLKRTKESVC